MRIVATIFLFALLVSKVDAESNACAKDDCACQASEAKCVGAAEVQLAGFTCNWDDNGDCHQNVVDDLTAGMFVF
jgi:hypothetical protein